MSARTKIPYKTSTTIRLIAPTDVVADPKNPLDNAVDGATSTFKVYDPAKDEVVSVDEALGQTEWGVTNAAAFQVGDVVEVTENDGSILSGTLTGVDPVAGTITSNVALLVGADAGQRTRVRLGPQVTMTEYGIPALGTRDWGFQGALVSDHAGLEIDLEVDVEISFVGAPSGGLDLLEVICAVVKQRKDCDD